MSMTSYPKEFVLKSLLIAQPPSLVCPLEITLVFPGFEDVSPNGYDVLEPCWQNTHSSGGENNTMPTVAKGYCKLSPNGSVLCSLRILLHISSDADH